MTKLLSCRYNMDTNRVEARFADGTTLAIDCIAIEDEYGNTPAQRAELDWLLYNRPPLAMNKVCVEVEPSAAAAITTLTSSHIPA